MKRITGSVLGIIAIFAMAITTSHAAKPGGIVMLGVAAVPDYEGSNDYEAAPALVFQHNWKSGRSVSFGGTAEAGRAARLKFNLVSSAMHPTVKAGPVIQYRFGRDGVEDSQVDKMSDVDDAIELGAFIGVEKGNTTFNFTAVGDVSDEHHGYVLELAANHTIPVNDKFRVTLGASMSHASDDYTEAYFGVTPKDSAKSGIPVYDPAWSWKDLGLSAAAHYKHDNNWGLMVFTKWYRLQGDAESSPLVGPEGDNDQFLAGLAITYSH